MPDPPQAARCSQVGMSYSFIESGSPLMNQYNIVLEILNCRVLTITELQQPHHLRLQLDHRTATSAARCTSIKVCSLTLQMRSAFRDEILILIDRIYSF